MKNNFHFHNGCIRKSHLIFMTNLGILEPKTSPQKSCDRSNCAFFRLASPIVFPKCRTSSAKKEAGTIPHQQIPPQLHPRKLIWEQKDNHLKMWFSFLKNGGFPASSCWLYWGRPGISRSTWMVSSISSSKTFLGQALQRQGLSPIPAPTFSRRKIPPLMYML